MIPYRLCTVTKISAFLLLLGVGLPALALPPQSFSQAKRIASSIYQEHPVSFYCGCPITYQGKKMQPNLDACGYQIRRQKVRAERIEWEHVVPAWQLGHQLQCWQDGGRSHCRRSSEKFRQMEADLHNLVPAVGEVNGDRSNYRFVAEVNQAQAVYGACKVRIDFKGKRVAPPEEKRGEIARIYLYMADKYQLRLSKQQSNLFQAWNKLYPVTAWELQRDVKIQAIQGDSNPWIHPAHGLGR